MSTFSSPFPLGWWSFDLGELRACEGTYERYDYASLPPLETTALIGDFAFLQEADDEVEPVNGDLLEEIRVALSTAGLELPSAFERFMGDGALQDAVPSCTGCEWDLGDAPVPCPVEPGAFTVRFLRDQQDCLFWYLYLAPGRPAIVICSPRHFDAVARDEALPTAESVVASTVAVAPEFETFVYRYWVENELWELGNDLPEDLEELEDDEEFEPALIAYVRHYRGA